MLEQSAMARQVKRRFWKRSMWILMMKTCCKICEESFLRVYLVWPYLFDVMFHRHFLARKWVGRSAKRWK